MKRKYIWIGLAIVVLSGAGYGYFQFNRTKPTVDTLAAKFNVNADSLLHEFETNENAANQKYQGLNLVIQVSGMVKGMDTDENGRLTVLLGDTTSLSSVRCAIDSLHTADLAGYTRGQAGSFKGYFNGYKADITGLLGADVELNACIPVDAVSEAVSGEN